MQPSMQPLMQPWIFSEVMSHSCVDLRRWLAEKVKRGVRMMSIGGREMGVVEIDS